jgi:membrane protease YdiL (CAAX protease family)
MLLAGRVLWARVGGRKAGKPHMSSATSRLETAPSPGLSRFSVVVVPTYCSAIVAAEIVATLVDARWGVALHIGVLWALLIGFSWAKETAKARLLLALCLAPLIRILSLAMPLEEMDLVYWFLIVSVPVMAAALTVARTLGLTRQQAWWPALILLVATGFGEELVFRGVMQSASADALGKMAILYVAAVFAVLHIGYKSAPDVAFAFIVGLFFGWVVARTQSLLGVTLCHGTLNVMLYVIVPFTAIAVD